MRKIILLFAVSVFFLAGAFAASASSDKAGDVVSLRGKAVVERAEKEIMAEKSLVLLEKDNVGTGEKSRIKMLFRDDSILALGSLSRLSVSRYLYSPEDKRAESVYELLDGKLRAVVGNSDFSVKSPTALAAARGTIFVVWYDSESNTTGVAVLEGEVQVRNIVRAVPGEQTLTAGQMTRVAGSSPPSKPEPFKVIKQTGPVDGTDIGPIVYELTFEDVPDVAFMDTRAEGMTPDRVAGGIPGRMNPFDVRVNNPQLQRVNGIANGANGAFRGNP